MEKEQFDRIVNIIDKSLEDTNNSNSNAGFKPKPDNKVLEEDNSRRLNHRQIIQKIQKLDVFFKSLKNDINLLDQYGEEMTQSYYCSQIDILENCLEGVIKESALNKPQIKDILPFINYEENDQTYFKENPNSILPLLENKIKTLLLKIVVLSKGSTTVLGDYHSLFFNENKENRKNVEFELVAEVLDHSDSRKNSSIIKDTELNEAKESDIIMDNKVNKIIKENKINKITKETVKNETIIANNFNISNEKMKKSRDDRSCKWTDRNGKVSYTSLGLP